MIAKAITYLIALILSITVHEYGHALLADRLGDRLPRTQGRLTLNPLAHIDPLGTILLPLLVVFTGAPLFGWGRPVQTNPAGYTRRLRAKTGHMLVAAAGPAMNLVLALVVSALLILYVRIAADHTEPHLVANAILLIQLNLILMFFNLLPVPPLDGGAVLRGLLPDSAAGFLDPLQRYGGFILLALLFTGFLGVVMAPATNLVARFVELVLHFAL
jgi:Zn-dependent protease